MDNPHKLNQVFAAFFTEWALSNLTSSKSALFVTTTFEHESEMRCRRETAGLSLGSYEMRAFQHLYNRIARALVGSNYNRPSKRDRLPRVACFLDSEGSKFWRSAGDTKNIHQHSIWVVEKEEIDILKDGLDLMGRDGDFFRNLGFDEIDVREIGDGYDDLSRVVTYASKHVGFDTRDLKLGTGFEFYPLGVSY